MVDSDGHVRLARKDVPLLEKLDEDDTDAVLVSDNVKEVSVATRFGAFAVE